MSNIELMFSEARNEHEPKPLEALRVLVSVSDRRGIVEFINRLKEILPLEVVATSGTASHLTKAGIEVTPVEKITGVPKLLDGRIKMIHLPIFAAILVDQYNPEHMRQLEKIGVKPFDMVIVNLYPFKEVVQDERSTLSEVIENIDIGGPAALRAAAKNFQSVIVVCSPEDYPQVIEGLKESRNLTFEQRRELALKAFELTRDFDEMIVKFFSH